MRGKHYAIGSTAGLIDQKHAEKMGKAVFLFDWAIRRQTGVAPGNWGIVLYGRPISYHQIKSETRFPIRTLKRWMARLVDYGYIRIRRDRYGMAIFIANQKKFKNGQRQISTDFHSSRGASFGIPEVPEVAPLSTKSGTSGTKMESLNTIADNEIASRGAIPSLRSTVLNTPKIETTASANPAAVSIASLARKMQLPQITLSERDFKERVAELRKQAVKITERRA